MHALAIITKLHIGPVGVLFGERSEQKQTNNKAMFYVYILKSLKDNKFYTGYSGNLRKRIREHHLGNVLSTKNRRLLELIYYEAYQNKENALKREKFLKTTRGKMQLRKQIEL